jgi:hypothetical protein
MNPLLKKITGMFLRSKTPLVGTLSAELIYADGTTKKVLEKKNVITLTAKQVILSSIYLTNQLSDPITTLNIGTGGCIDPQGMFPKPVSQNMTSLFTPLLSVVASYTINPAQPSVTFLATVDQGTANGQQITEAGLFKASGGMFNILTFPAIPKTEEFSIQFSWEVEMS